MAAQRSESSPGPSPGAQTVLAALEISSGRLAGKCSAARVAIGVLAANRTERLRVIGGVEESRAAGGLGTRGR